VTRRPRLATLAGGVALILIGIWIVLDQSGALPLSLEALAPALAAALGLMLVASGFEDQG
jgi:hypothetical protein